MTVCVGEGGVPGVPVSVWVQGWWAEDQGEERSLHCAVITIKNPYINKTLSHDHHSQCTIVKGL